MSTEPQESVSHWIAAQKVGEADAAQCLWEQYCDALVLLARARLGATPRDAADEDIALSALHGFYQGVERGRFPRLGDRFSLWRLLVTITVRKALDQSKRQHRKRRGWSRVRGESGLAGGKP